GNERRRWHGTSRTCLLGDPGCTQLCTNSDCSLCNIIRSSFNLDHYGTGTGWGRFGRGHYTSATSSKSDDYAKNLGYATTSNYKTMLLNLVAVGNAFKTYDDMDDLTSPPAGYDAVIGEVGGTLNYDELVVYRNDAIIPAYLVVYS
ncbi:ADP-ribosylation, partial [Stereum hirsutum FP-91666 SS1]|uniref:ADP-ribosylation n=1 Tax=Stereum hirsutum (strain FP-91666) TaxID=721885 RepID=UPI0004409E39